MAAEKPDSPSTDPVDSESPTPDLGETPTPVPGVWTTQRKVIAAIAAAVVVIAAGVTFAVVSGNTGTPTADPTHSSGPSTSGSPTPEPTTPSSTAPADPSVPADPVPISDPAVITPGVVAAITKFESVQGEAKTPGEVSGPSVRITVTITNSTSAAVDLSTTVVTAYYGDGQTPALELSQPGGAPLPASVAAGAAATGIYIFTIPEDQRGNVRIMVDYSVDVQPLVFQGAVPA